MTNKQQLPRTSIIAIFLFLLIFSSVTSALLMRDKLNKMADAQYLSEKYGAALDLTELIYELQKERGLSAGFSGSNGKLFQENLVEQRTKTDLRLRDLQNLVPAIRPSGGSAENSVELDNINARLQQRSSIRQNVDQLKKSVESWAYYTDLIAKIITHTHTIHVENGIAGFGQLSSNYTTLLNLQELAGQERGTINKVISSGHMNTSTYQQISTLIAQQDRLIEELQYARKILPERVIENITHKSINGRINSVRQSLIAKYYKNDALNRMQSSTGYGGLIHVFKNYVLRGDEEYFDQFTTLHLRLTDVIWEYRNIPGISSKEVSALDAIEQAFTAYRENMIVVGDMRNSDATVAEIDKMVVVDDVHALEGIKLLQSYISPIVAGDWFWKSSLRIDKINDARQRLKGYAETYLSDIEQNAFHVILLYSLFIGLVFIILCLLSARLYCRTT